MNTEKTVRVVRWIARAGAGLTAVFILFFFLAHAVTDGVTPLLYLTARETAMMAAFAAVWLGLVVGWKWDMVGGLLTVGGVIAFYALDYLFSGMFPRGAYFLVFALPGVLFLYCGVMEAANGK